MQKCSLDALMWTALLLRLTELDFRHRGRLNLRRTVAAFGFVLAWILQFYHGHLKSLAGLICARVFV
jgi:hypothetical protein